MKEFVVRTPKQLGPVLQGFRKATSLTQENVGNLIGLEQSDISRLEFDPSNASLSRIFKLLSALELELVVRHRSKSTDRSEW